MVKLLSFVSIGCARFEGVMGAKPKASNDKELHEWNGKLFFCADSTYRSRGNGWTIVKLTPGGKPEDTDPDRINIRGLLVHCNDNKGDCSVNAGSAIKGQGVILMSFGLVAIAMNGASVSAIMLLSLALSLTLVPSASAVSSNSKVISLEIVDCLHQILFDLVLDAMSTMLHS